MGYDPRRHYGYAVMHGYAGIKMLLVCAQKHIDIVSVRTHTDITKQQRGERDEAGAQQPVGVRAYAGRHYSKTVLGVGIWKRDTLPALARRMHDQGDMGQKKQEALRRNRD
jgi:hypothetical protein